MTYLDIDAAIISITEEKCSECKVRLDTIPKENATERKALQLEYGMYTFCGNAGLLFSSGKREKVLEVRRSFWNNRLDKYPKLKAIYDELSEKEKMKFLAVLQAELYIRDQWLPEQYSRLAEAEAAGDTDRIFEYQIKIGAVYNMLAVWEAWRVEHKVYPRLFEGVTHG